MQISKRKYIIAQSDVNEMNGVIGWVVDITIHAEIDNVVTKGEQEFVNDDVVNLSVPKYLQRMGRCFADSCECSVAHCKGGGDCDPKEKIENVHN